MCVAGRGRTSLFLVLALTAAAAGAGCGRPGDAGSSSEASEDVSPRAGSAAIVATAAPAGLLLEESVVEESAPLLPAGPAERADGSELDSLPWAERIALEQALAASDPRHAPRMDQAGPVLEAPGGLSASFGAQGGARISVGDRAVALRASAIGRGAARTTSRTALVVESSPRIAGPEVRTDRGGGVVEWWRSLPSGLEHGLTIERRRAGDGELVVEVEVSGELTAHALSAEAIELRDGTGARIATYAHLVVLDADGARVPARMEARGAGIALFIEDAGARYPLVIDPLLVGVEEVTLLASDGAASDALGAAVSLTSDGSRALVGAPFDDTAGGTDAGSARVFLRTGATWTEEATLLASGGLAMDYFGYSVSLTSDGSRALVGAFQDNTAGGAAAGSARVFLRTGTAWAEEATLLASDGAGFDNFGYSVSLTSDGSRALVGALADDTAGGFDAGSARVFFRTGTTWAEEATLLASGGLAMDYFGYSVSLTSDGSRALVGAYGDDTAGGPNAGSARMFLRTGTTWAPEATLLASGGAEDDLFGYSVSLTSDGSRALVGALYDDTAGGPDAGSAHVFLRTGTTWAEDATLLGSDGAASDYFGYSVSLTSDGSRALVGAHGDDTTVGPNRGSARVFLRTGTTWAEDATLLGSDGAASDFFGYSVSLTLDGSRALVGAYRDDTAGGPDAGSARVFTFRAADPNGTACARGTTCRSGLCIDAVCCDTACGSGDATDCQACAAALTGGASGTCAPRSAAVAPTVTCRASVGPCDPTEFCSAGSTACPPDAFHPSTLVCRASTDACDGVETCTGSSAGCPPDALLSASTTCRASVDVCDAAETCTGGSAACPADALLPAATTCRAPADLCDAAETCTGSSAACPADALFPAATTCRPSAEACDVVETCAGSSPACPADAMLPASTICRAATSTCDVPESCTGTSAGCPTDVPALLDTQCRASAGACDPAEACDGSSFACPADLRSPSGARCGGMTGSCTTPGTCDGATVSCGGGTLLTAGTVCQPAVAGNPCDVDDVCDGVSDACPVRFAPAETACGSAPSGECDAPDHCTGSSGDCDAAFLADVECRAAAGACDGAELCTGDSPSCPPDTVEAAGMVCRASIDPSCDPAEACDGAAAACPSDVITCGATDGGRADAGGRADSGSTGMDAGSPPVAAEGCACRAGGGPARSSALALLAALPFVLVVGLRRHRPRRR